MSLNLAPRQRTMLTHMGLRLDFLPASVAHEDPAPALEAPTLQRLEEPPRPKASDMRALAPSAEVRPEARSSAKAPVAATQTVVVPRADIAQADWGPLKEAVSGCQACPLCLSRRQTVFGMGAEPAASGEGVDLMIVGEAPDEHEDLQGLPFAGAAGQLLDQMLSALGLSRQPEGGAGGRVYLTNALKCRPPGDRNPQGDEVAQCQPFLRRQIELLRPRLLLAMGRFAAQALLAGPMPEVAQKPLGQLRGRSYDYGGIPLVVTYHPAYLLRNPAEKGKVWADLCLAQSLVSPLEPSLADGT